MDIEPQGYGGQCHEIVMVRDDSVPAAHTSVPGRLGNHAHGRVGTVMEYHEDRGLRRTIKGNTSSIGNFEPWSWFKHQGPQEGETTYATQLVADHTYAYTIWDPQNPASDEDASNARHNISTPIKRAKDGIRGDLDDVIAVRATTPEGGHRAMWNVAPELERPERGEGDGKQSQAAAYVWDGQNIGQMNDLWRLNPATGRSSGADGDQTEVIPTIRHDAHIRRDDQWGRLHIVPGDAAKVQEGRPQWLEIKGELRYDSSKANEDSDLGRETAQLRPVIRVPVGETTITDPDDDDDDLPPDGPTGGPHPEVCQDIRVRRIQFCGGVVIDEDDLTPEGEEEDEPTTDEVTEEEDLPPLPGTEEPTGDDVTEGEDIPLPPDVGPAVGKGGILVPSGGSIEVISNPGKLTNDPDEQHPGGTSDGALIFLPPESSMSHWPNTNLTEDNEEPSQTDIIAGPAVSYGSGFPTDNGYIQKGFTWGDEKDSKELAFYRVTGAATSNESLRMGQDIYGFEYSRSQRLIAKDPAETDPGVMTVEDQFGGVIQLGDGPAVSTGWALTMPDMESSDIPTMDWQPYHSGSTGTKTFVNWRDSVIRANDYSVQANNGFVWTEVHSSNPTTILPDRGAMWLWDQGSNIDVPVFTFDDETSSRILVGPSGGGSIGQDEVVVGGDGGSRTTSDGNFTWDGSTATINGKLTVSGMIDPTALVFSEQTANPRTIQAGDGVVWVKDDAPTTLWFTDDSDTDYEIGLLGGSANHDLLSTTHDDTAAATPVQGDLIVADSTPQWGRLPADTTGQVLALVGSDPTWTDTFSTAKTYQSYTDYEETTEPGDPSANTIRLWVEDRGGVSAFRWKDAGGLILDIASDQHVICKNTSGASISKGSAVYDTGTTGTFTTIAKAKADSQATMPAIGITMEAISNNGFGRVMTSGDLLGLSTLPTATYTDGDRVWVSATTAGELTPTEPSHPDIRQPVGSVIQASNGSSGRLRVNASLDVDGVEHGTLENTFRIGDDTAGAKVLRFRNSNDGDLSWNPTANRTLTLPDLTGTVATVDGGQTFSSATWQGTVVGVQYGGTGADLSGTGGASQVLQQTSTGGAVTVGQLAFSDISGTATDSQLPVEIAYEDESNTFTTNQRIQSYLDLDEISAPSTPGAGIGRLWTEDTNGVPTLHFAGDVAGDVELGEDVTVIVRNTTGATLTAGTVVYRSGAAGNRPTVAKAKADDPSTMPAIGLVFEDIANNSDGRVLQVGREGGIDTSAFNVGDELYVSATTAGDLTATQPPHPNLSQEVGSVVTSNAGSGRISVDIRGEQRGFDGTRLDVWRIGDTTAGAKTVRFRAGSDGDLDWNPTGARTLTLPDLSGTVATIDGGQTFTSATWQGTDVAVAHGGTGASTASAARTNLGVAIGSDVQAWSADLDTYASNPLTATELAELQNIGATTITAAQWGYVGGLDQDLSTGDSVTFNDLTLTAAGPLNITEQSAEPGSPSAEDIYLDDGTNTASGNPGWRRYTGAAWEDISAAGGLSGPGSSTDNALARWDGTGGDTVQDSGVTLSDGDQMTIPREDAGTTTVLTDLILRRTTSGTAAAGLGVALDMELEDAAGNTETAARIQADWTTATDTAEDAELAWSVMSGGTLTERMVLADDGLLTLSGGISTTGTGTNVERIGGGITGDGGTDVILIGDNAKGGDFGNITVIGPRSEAGGPNVTIIGPDSDGIDKCVSVGPNNTNTSGTSVIMIGESLDVTGSTSVMIARNTTVTAQKTTGIGGGSGISPSGGFNVGIGADVTFGARSVVVGQGAEGGGNSVIAGRGAGGSSNSTSIGYASGDSSIGNFIALGRGSTPTSSGQFVAGGPNLDITDIFFGSGVSDGSPVDATIHGTGGDAASVVGGTLMLAGGKGGDSSTAGGDVVLQTADSSGGQTLDDRLTVAAAGHARVHEQLRVGDATDADAEGDFVTGLTGDHRLFHDQSAGALQLHDDGTTPYELRFMEASNYVGFKAPTALTADQIWELPASDGTSGQVLQTDGSGVLSFADDAGAAAFADGDTDGNDRLTDPGSYTAFSKSYTIPANTLVQGTQILVRAGGTGSSAGLFQVRVSVGGTNYGSMSTSTDGAWDLDATISCYESGATGNLQGNVQAVDAAGAFTSTAPIVDTSVDTTGTLDVEIEAIGSGDASDTIDLRYLTVQIIED